MYDRRSFGLLAAAAALAPLMLAFAEPADAQAKWPTQTVKIVVPYPPGGGADGLPRVLTDHLAKMWGQAVIIENRSGAGGNVGAELASRAAPDGYTILSAPAPVFTVNPALYKKLNFDPSKFKPIVALGSAATVLSVHPSVGVKTLQEFLDKAKKEPGMNYGSQGNGSTSHITAAMFEAAAGIKLTHVPYRGSGPMMNDLVGGHIKLTFDNLASALVQHKAGKVRILAVCSPKRSPFLPEMPTMIESGLKDFESVAWFGMVAPAGTPDDIIAKIHKDVAEVLKREDVQKKYAALGVEAMGDGPAEMGKLIERDRKKWADVIRDAKIPQVQ
jgi:tripartite-type tricarboxylate transporter receptor subunit TctC